MMKPTVLPSAIADGEEFAWTTGELKKLVSTITDDLEELDEAVTAMKVNPKQFRVCTHDDTSQAT